MGAHCIRDCLEYFSFITFCIDTHDGSALHRHIHHHCEVWHEPIHGETIRVSYQIFVQSAPGDLVRIGGEKKPVEQYNLPALSTVLTDPHTSWQRVNLEGWYGEGARDIEIATDTAVWYQGGLPALPIRWVLGHAIRSTDSIRKRCSRPTWP